MRKGIVRVLIKSKLPICTADKVDFCDVVLCVAGDATNMKYDGQALDGSNAKLIFGETRTRLNSEGKKKVIINDGSVFLVDIEMSKLMEKFHQEAPYWEMHVVDVKERKEFTRFLFDAYAD
jgi:hypothetical protein